MEELQSPKRFDDLKIVIENPKGTYKSFETEDDPVWKDYPLKGITYPVDYGYIDGYKGEDGDDMDVFVGTGDKFGFIKVWRLDVPEETKFFANLTQEELDSVVKEFSPVLISHSMFSEEEFMRELNSHVS
jgi:hypothetical protein